MRPPRIVVGLLLAGIAMTACTSGGKQATTATDTANTIQSSSVSDSWTTTTSTASVDPNAADVNSAGDIPDNQVFVAYTDAAGRFTVQVPEGWSRTSAADGSIWFTDNFNAIDLSETQTPNAPSEQSAIATELPALQSTTGGFEFHNVTTVQRRAGPAVVVAYRATSAPNAVTGKTVVLAVERYEFWAAGNEVVVTVSGPVNADNVDPWRTVTDSFAWT